jgi:hypothetical protein
MRPTTENFLAEVLDLNERYAPTLWSRRSARLIGLHTRAA